MACPWFDKQESVEIRVLEPDELGSAIYCFVTLSKLLSFSVPHSLYLRNWDTNKSIDLKLQRVSA